jgi:CYTH domain-containing protein
VSGNEVCLNIKKIKSDSRIRDEWEFRSRLNDDEIRELIGLSIKKPIEKVRYRTESHGLIWEIDVYRGENEGLITAEVELPEEDYVISFPEWVDNKHEISNDERFFNRNLGDFPYKLFRDSL